MFIFPLIFFIENELLKNKELEYTKSQYVGKKEDGIL